ncbi:hypothetical protein CGX12_01690 [Zobellella denitrificans]|uniref:ATP-binding protein n=1 Tax=Zobellella denitrificans TaxID=347534 RepID=UPI000B8BE06D|nr:ATP-binding protein [Zobellella denitrificans]OXS16798.1 hypothetical protein CGX12_01690 [Zobellella denitrificans]
MEKNILATAGLRARNWIWLSMAAAVLVCLLVAGLHYHHKSRLGQAAVLVQELGRAGDDLSQGLLHLTLSTTADSPWQRERGLVLLQQAMTGYQRTLARLDPAADASAFRRDLDALEQQLQPLRQDPFSAAQSLSLRLAMYRLNSSAQQLDGELRRQLGELSGQLDLYFDGGVVLALLLLGGICLGLFRLEQSRSRQQQRLELLEAAVSQLNDIVMITEAGLLDEPGPRIVFVNAAFERHTGYRRGEVIGRTPRILHGPETSVEERRRIRRALEHWQPVQAEMLNYTKGGDKLWLELSIVPLTDRQGRYTHWVSVERNITERRELEEQLHQARRLESVGQLTGGIAHDFNNLLTVIIGNAELLQEQLAEADPLRPLAESMLSAAQRGAELTSRLLAFARRQALVPRVVAVNELMDEMQLLLRRTLGHHVAIEVVQEPGLWPALVDPAQLESALLNLCINARDAMPGGGRLTLESANISLDEEDAGRYGDVAPGDYVQLVVSDTGSGIAAEHLHRVFEPFFTTKEQGRGTGLGLSMVFGFIKQSGGHITLYSEPGEGTTVRMYLPRSPVATQPAAPVTAPGRRGGDETILLVEDDAEVRRYAEIQLQRLGYTVLLAANGSSALQILRERQDIDLLFTDVMMPGGINGPELVEQTRCLHPHIKVLYSSGYAASTLLHQGRVAPEWQLLTKPYRRAELEAKVRQALEQRP